jgi:hypothetical protein
MERGEHQVRCRKSGDMSPQSKWRGRQGAFFERGHDLGWRYDNEDFDEQLGDYAAGFPGKLDASDFGVGSGPCFVESETGSGRGTTAFTQ